MTMIAFVIGSLAVLLLVPVIVAACMGYMGPIWPISKGRGHKTPKYVLPYKDPIDLANKEFELGIINQAQLDEALDEAYKVPKQTAPKAIGAPSVKRKVGSKSSASMYTYTTTAVSDREVIEAIESSKAQYEAMKKCLVAQMAVPSHQLGGSWEEMQHVEDMLHAGVISKAEAAQAMGHHLDGRQPLL